MKQKYRINKTFDKNINLIRNVIFILIAICSLILSVSAYPRINNNGLSLPDVNGTFNSTGLYFGTDKITKSYDVVVCRGTSTADDIYKLATCDVVCLSTTNYCNTTLSLAVSSPNKRVLVMPGIYYIASPVIVSSNVTLEGYNAYLVSNGTESVWSGSLHRGLLENYNVPSSSSFTENIKIKGFNFILNGTPSAITLGHFNNIEISDNKFTGEVKAYGGVIYIDNQHASGNISNLYIKNNHFKNINGTTNIIYIFTNSGKFIDNINILNNLFYNTSNIAISINPSSTVKNILIQGNTFKELDSYGSSTTSYPLAAHISLGTAYVVENLRILDNTYINGYEKTPQNHRSGFVFFYSVNNTIISNNIIDYNVNAITDVINDSFAFAPGRTTTPDIGVIISNNQVRGFNKFWDPDSMVNAEVYGNTMTNVGDVPIVLGYNQQHNIHIHDNIIVNYNHPNFGHITTFNSTIELGACGYGCNGSIIENNQIFDYANPSNLKNGIYLNNYNYSDVIVKNNNLYLSNGQSLTNQIKNISLISFLPSFFGNNFLFDNININTTGNGTFNSLFIKNLLLLTANTTTVTCTAGSIIFDGVKHLGCNSTSNWNALY